VALSGGVDSSVAAALLLRQGHQVEGIYMKLWGGAKHGSSCSTADETSAQRAAEHLRIPLHVVDWSAEFEQQVINPHVDGLARGEVSNPCLSCNRSFKIKGLMDYADQHDFPQVATGHYARIVQHNGRHWLARAADNIKDQSYVMWMLSGAHLSRLRLPIGTMSKANIRALARSWSIPAATTPDSMDLCFSTESVTRNKISLSAGRMITTKGRDLGPIENIELTVIGQRRGLPNTASNAGERHYIVQKDLNTKTVTIGTKTDTQCRQISINNCTWTWNIPQDTPLTLQTSAHGEPHPVHIITYEHTHVTLQTDHNIWRPSPGQAGVLYAQDRVVGGGYFSSHTAPTLPI